MGSGRVGATEGDGSLAVERRRKHSISLTMPACILPDNAEGRLSTGAPDAPADIRCTSPQTPVGEIIPPAATNGPFCTPLPPTSGQLPPTGAQLPPTSGQLPPTSGHAPTSSTKATSGPSSRKASESKDVRLEGKELHEEEVKEKLTATGPSGKGAQGSSRFSPASDIYSFGICALEVSPSFLVF